MATAGAYDAFLIDPFLKSVTKVSIERGKNELKCIYALLGCDIVETAIPSFGNNGDRIIVDEEGLFKEEQAFFFADGLKLAGKGLYVGGKGSLFDTPKIAETELIKHINFDADPYRLWIETFLSEKGIDTEYMFEFGGDDDFAFISMGAIVEQICISDADVKEMIKAKIVEIDFANADPLDFFRFLGEQMANQWRSENT